ncbi:MAG: terminase TerL endonuclease subunit [Xanthobacteraceae bacterium]|jgi:hypothetical protein
MMLDRKALRRYRADPCAFIEECLVNPETGKAYGLLEAERAFLRLAFRRRPDGRLLYPELIYSAIKKSGKTTFAAMFVITVIVLFGERHAEAYLIANDFDQAQSRVFEVCRRIIEASPLLRREARVGADRITFPATGATITAVASDYAGAAGGHPTIVVADELWGAMSERARRLWDEFVPVPTRQTSCRLVVSHAGYEDQSELLHELYERGLKQPVVGTDLYAGDGVLMFWSHVPISPLQTEAWLADMRRSLRPAQYLRMIENRFTTTESGFATLEAWDRIVDPGLTPVLSDRSLPIYVGIDASVKHDSTAIVACATDGQRVRLVWHRIFQPSKDDPLDFEATIESTVLELKKRFNVQKVLYDPWQMQSTAQRLARAGVRMTEFPQSVGNLTIASQGLYELITGRNLTVYPDAAMRLAVSRAVALETSRGWRIAKEKQSHKIDVVVALAMAAHAASTEQLGVCAQIRANPQAAWDLVARINAQGALRRAGGGRGCCGFSDY